MVLDDLKARDPVAAAAIARTLKLEGGFVDDAADPGGATNFGVSLRFALGEIALHPDELALFDVDHDGQVTRADIGALTADQAAEIYYDDIWVRCGYANLVPADVAWKVFDICVNTGPRRAAIILQQALGLIGHAVTVDGEIGPGTLAAVQACAQLPLLSALRTAQAAFYQGLVTQKPQLLKFAQGWARRAQA